MKTIDKSKVTYKLVIPETEEEKKEIEKLIKDVKNEKIDASKLKIVGPDDNEDEIFKD